MDPHGEYAVYMDRQRQAIVRLKPATGEMQIDRSYFNEDAKLIIGEGADPVLAWDKGELVRAEWTESEDFPGYDEE